MQMIEPNVAGSPEAQSADLKAENIATLKALAKHFDPEQRLNPGKLLQD